jgi:hypothetical protein
VPVAKEDPATVFRIIGQPGTLGELRRHREREVLTLRLDWVDPLRLETAPGNVDWLDQDPALMIKG